MGSSNWCNEAIGAIRYYVKFFFKLHFEIKSYTKWTVAIDAMK